MKILDRAKEENFFAVYLDLFKTTVEEAFIATCAKEVEWNSSSTPESSELPPKYNLEKQAENIRVV